jgi:hypothetical protein
LSKDKYGGVMRPRPFAKMIKREYGREISEKDLNAEMSQEDLHSDDDLADVEEELSREGIIVSSSFKITPDEADWLLERRGAIAEGWETLPKGWTMESVKKYWDTLTGDRKHKITKCMKEMEGKVGNTGAFCASLARKLGVASMETDMAFKITAEERNFLIKRRKVRAATSLSVLKKIDKLKEKISDLTEKHKMKVAGLREQIKGLREDLKKAKAVEREKVKKLTKKKK